MFQLGVIEGAYGQVLSFRWRGSLAAATDDISSR